MRSIYFFLVISFCVDSGLQANLLVDILGRGIKFAQTFSVPQIRSADITNLRFQYMTACCTYTVPVALAETLWDNPRFGKNRKIVVFASGWQTTLNSSDGISELQKAFMWRPEVNFLVVDTFDYLTTLYMWSAQNTNFIGKSLSLGLQKLANVRPGVNIHLIGHSLGTHLMGFAGRKYFELTGRLVDRITGLDPAKPCFIGRTSYQGLTSNDARLVDVIHTNPGILGQLSPVGHVDFYPGGEDPIQNGCSFIVCSHYRAVSYFVESVYPGQESNFWATKCNSTKMLRAKTCDSSATVMGYAVNWNARGIYYLEVNSDSPYGMNAKSSLRGLYNNFNCQGVKC
ncbi:vitellogenin-3-like isoform X2 [Drosophila hydei]|uniref:Vitellogenin-3-like isoform X2 n=1 Tax=Drosophila hydei TaxID=7224 RepID=A0A6J1MLF7_DROHY|nr:vitellogenin-3-like isoform X2 [Drosophila hydei]